MQFMMKDEALLSRHVHAELLCNDTLTCISLVFLTPAFAFVTLIGLQETDSGAVRKPI